MRQFEHGSQTHKVLYKMESEWKTKWKLELEFVDQYVVN